MRTFTNLLPKRSVTLLAIMFILTPGLTAQPQYYNYNNVGSSINTFPFGQAAGKAVNWLFPAGAFNQPAPLPPGQMITKVYFFVITGGSRTYTNLHILMAQSTITTLTSGQFYSGPWDTVYFNPSITLSPGPASWMPITLDKPFPYDPAKSLLLFVGQCGGPGTGVYVRQISLTPYRRVWSVGGCPFTPYPSGDGATVNFGVDVLPATPQYYNYNTPLGPNSFPFDVSGGKMVQWLIGPGEFNQPAGAPAGNITTIYFYMGGTATGRRFINFNILMRRTALTSMPSGMFYPEPMDTVFHRDVMVLSSAASAWMPVVLDVPYMYRPDSSLIIQVGQCGYQPSAGSMTLYQTAVSGSVRRPWSVGGCPFVHASQDAQVANCGIYIPIPVGINSNNSRIPDAYKLEQNYPNPFNPVTKISYSIPKPGNVKLVIYDMLGREIGILSDKFTPAGIYSVDFDASNLSSGVYLYTIESGYFRDTKKMMLVK